MNKPLRNALAALAVLLGLLAAGTAGGAFYLLDYSLKPVTDSRDTAAVWARRDSTFPGLRDWRDRLKAEGRWHDTVIQSPDGTPLHAYYLTAARPTRHTAIVVHGYGDCAVVMMHLARMYERDLHANVLLPDLRNAGHSGGDHIQMGWFDRLDVKQWTKTAPQMFGDTLSVIVHGHSMGAATTMMLSGEPDVPAYVKGYVEDCGYTSVDDEFSKEITERFGLPRWPLVPLASALCKMRYGWSFTEASALEQVRKCTRPMLFIHGTADDFVPTRMVHPLYAAHRGPKQGWLAPGAAHADSYRKYPREYTRRVKTFADSVACW